MQGNGFKIGVTVAFLLLSMYYLFPTAQRYLEDRKLNDMTAEERQTYEDDNYERLQSLSERALSLGLDLQGGMHVALEVQVAGLVRDLARDTDAAFDSVMAVTRARTETSGDDFVTAFGQEFAQRDPNALLARYFRNDAAGLTRRSTNDEVLTYLRTEATQAVDRAMSIVRDRVDRFGVAEPSIQKQGDRRIIVELPGVDDPVRVRRLLQGTAKLEFRLMAEPADLNRALTQTIALYNNESDTTATDSTAADSTRSVLLDDPPELTNPLLAVMTPLGQDVRFGLVAERDTAEVMDLLDTPEVAAFLPSNVELMLSAKAEGALASGDPGYVVLGVRRNVELGGEVVTDARPDIDQYNRPEVAMEMNAEGARIWARLTGANVNKNVAIVLDGRVVSYPNIRQRISGGRTSITGVSQAEAEDIVTVLKAGALPAPLDIVEERTVGPSLGAKSIRAGTLSIVVGLMLVAVFMVLYYRTAGLVANVALLLNIVFIFGILAGFGATLTLPGIAGIVLTIGMAVDANVLIFERIREEMSTGKTLRASIEGGYDKALSAILDANITTFFMGVILYSFGVGSIKGFALTLMAGIISSLFTAIVVTRLFFDWQVVGRKRSVSYG